MIQFIYKGMSPKGVVTEEIDFKNINSRIKHHRNTQTTTLSLCLRVHKKQYFQETDLIQTLQMLSFFLEAGHTVIESLSLLEKHHQHNAIIFKKIINTIQKGTSFSSALSSHLKRQHKIIGHLMQLGEKTDSMLQATRNSTDHLIQHQNIRKDLKKALTYPLLLTGIIGAMVWALVSHLLPIMLPIITNQSHLSGATKFLIQIHTFYTHININLLMWTVCGLTLITISLFHCLNPLWRDRFIVKCPLLGSIVRNYYVVQISKKLSLMLPFSSNIVETITYIKEDMPHGLGRHILSCVRDRVKRGEHLDVILPSISQIPALYTDLMGAGSRTNTLNKSIKTATHYYEKQVRDKLDSINKTLPIVLLMSLGCILVFIAYAVLYPLYTIETWIQ